MINRRFFLALAGAAPFLRFSVARADDLPFSHAVSLFNDIKYAPDFKNFDYVRPDAPKGGKIRLPAYGTFDSLNPYTINGDPVGITVLDNLMVRSLDEPSTMYGL